MRVGKRVFGFWCIGRKRIEVTNIDGVGFGNTNRGNREW